MKSISIRIALIVVVCCVFVSSVEATRPVRPVPAGFYSLDSVSPTVLNTNIEAADVLFFPGTDSPMPGIATDGSNLGVNAPDSINSLSATTNGFQDGDTFAIVFSVDRQSVGGAPPEQALLDLGVPYNMQDQAERGQAAGDQYMALTLFTRMGPVPSVTKGSTSASNNTLLRNQFDEGGTSYAIDPKVSAEVGSATAQDNIDAYAKFESNSNGPTLGRGADLSGLYFTVRMMKKSGEANGRGRSGADIFFDSNPSVPDNTEEFAIADVLGLQFGDEIDALIVFDDNENGIYDGTDEVLFSLSRGSPSLLLFTDGSPAHIYKSTYGSMTPVMYASAFDLGLDPQLDNIDALDYLSVDFGPIKSASYHGIRAPMFGDYDHDADVDLVDLEAFVDLCISGPVEGSWYIMPTLECLITFDGNNDSDVDLRDFRRFQAVFTGDLSGTP